MTQTLAAHRPERSVSGLREPARRPSRRAITLWALQIGLGWCSALALEAVALLGAGPVLRPPTLVVLALSLLIGVGHVLVVPQWQNRVHRWDIDEVQAVSRSGWIVQQTRITPLARVQTVDARRGPLARLLGLATLRITTASSAGAISITGLDAAVVQQLVDRLTVVTDRDGGDAT